MCVSGASVVRNNANSVSTIFYYISEVNEFVLLQRKDQKLVRIKIKQNNARNNLNFTTLCRHRPIRV